jgi:hypothetical protein
VGQQVTAGNGRNLSKIYNLNRERVFNMQRFVRNRTKYTGLMIILENKKSQCSSLNTLPFLPSWLSKIPLLLTGRSISVNS